MRAKVIHYGVKAGNAGKNRALIQRVFEELGAHPDPHTDYLVVQCGDMFLHLVGDSGSASALASLPAFQAFQSQGKELREGEASVRPGEVIGAAGRFADALAEVQS